MANSSKDDSATAAVVASAGSIQPVNTPIFSEGEKVLAHHVSRFYEAKVQKAEIRKKGWKYFVHYLGWNKNWDEWVDEHRLMKYTEDNIMKHLAQDRNGTAKSGRSTHGKSKKSVGAKVGKEDIKSNVSKGKKRKNDSRS